MEVSDPYELKLFQMFQSCDTEQNGFLDTNALQRLCGLLELRDKGAVLIKDLSTEDDSTNSRVSFEQFKEALLNFLGTELDGGASTGSTTKTTQFSTGRNIECVKERVLVISNEVETYIESPFDSSDREVSPKLVMGTKKYGRRSRPQHHVIDDFSLTDSDQGGIVDDNDHNNCNKLVQRSSSQTDIPTSRRRCGPISAGDSKLKRCSSLPAQRNVRKLTQSGNNKSNNLLSNKQQQQQKQNPQQQQQQLSSSVESLDTPRLMETLPAHSIIDIWERAHISNARSILVALGFDEDEVSLTQLNKVLEDELRSLEDDSQVSLLRASLALHVAELTALRQTFRQLHDENVKLRADNKDANQRVAMLAVEIDERHASLEDSSKKEIRALEQRHATVMRDLTARMASDRENWTSLTARLDSRIKSFEQEEQKLRVDLERVRSENNDMELEQQKLQKQVTELLEKNIKLNKELADFQNQTHESDIDRSSADSEKKSSDDETLRLLDKISALQTENTNLRDKNDELVTEMENLNLELIRTKAKYKKNKVVDELVLEEGQIEGQDSVQTATKRRGDSPSKVHITGESPRLGKLRKCSDEAGGSENSDTSGEWMALNSELQYSTGAAACKSTGEARAAEEELAKLKKRLTELESELQKVRVVGEGTSAEERCKELENSLEQMQRAYEDCEDYWQSKLAEERQLFEKERQIYEDEQQESDKKFTELMEKVREYEEQFSKDGRLSPIEEKDTLEQQYADLEAEAEEIRENARRIFDEKSKEIETLQHEIEDLRLRLGESVEILTGAYELNNEATQRAQTGMQSPASSPISYLWQQSTIQEPAKILESVMSSPSKQRNNLSTSETAIFSTTPIDTQESSTHSSRSMISPIQKPGNQSKTSHSEGGDIADCETSSTTSGKSLESHSVASTHSVHHSQSGGNAAAKTSLSHENGCSSPGGMKEELKRLKYFEMSLKEQIKDLSLQRDGLVMELQQLQEARPVLEKAYARTAHPSLIQRVNQLELRNRHLQNAIKQQQHYTQSLMQQSWRQHQMELNDMQGRLETQSVMLSEQAQRLQNADVLVKDLYVENAHLTSTVQRLEQQRARVNYMHQQRQGLNGLNGLPGMP